MSEHARYEMTVRCMGMTRENRRCTKDAAYDLGGRCYCDRHYQKALEEKLNPKEKAK